MKFAAMSLSSAKVLSRLLENGNRVERSSCFDDNRL